MAEHKSEAASDLQSPPPNGCQIVCRKSFLPAGTLGQRITHISRKFSYNGQ